MKTRILDLTRWRRSVILAAAQGGVALVLASPPAITGDLDPQRVGSWPGYTRGPAQAVAVAGDYAYVGTPNLLQVIDVSDPANTRRVGSNSAFGARAVSVLGDKIYVVADQGLVILSKFTLLRFGLTSLEAGGQIRLPINGESGQRVRLQRSKNLVDWEDWQTMILSGAGCGLIDNTAGAPRRFYRLVEDQPPPYAGTMSRKVFSSASCRGAHGLQPIADGGHSTHGQQTEISTERINMKTQDKTTAAVSRHCPPSLLVGAMIGMAVPLWGQGPTLNIERSVLLTWPASESGHIVVQSDSADGPWAPSLEPIFKRFGEFCVAAPTREPMRLFELRRGFQFTDDFGDENEPWRLSYLLSNASEWNIAKSAGSLRVEADRVAQSFASVMLQPPGNSVAYADRSLAVDIVDWDESGDQAVFFAAGGNLNLTPPFSFYLAGLVFNRAQDGGQTSMRIGKETTPLRTAPIEVIPGNKFRLIFSEVGGQLTVSLFDITESTLNPKLIHSLSAADNSFPKGPVGILLQAEPGWPPFAVSLDNVIVSGTQ